MLDPDIAYAVLEYPGTKFPYGVRDKDGILLGFQSQAYVERYRIPIKGPDISIRGFS